MGGNGNILFLGHHMGSWSFNASKSCNKNSESKFWRFPSTLTNDGNPALMVKILLPRFNKYLFKGQAPSQKNFGILSWLSSLRY